MSLEQQLMRMVMDEMKAGHLILPTLPDVALSVSNIMSREDVDTTRVAQEISKDPAIAARLLEAANCAGSRGAGKPANSLQTAITRLGLNLTRALVNRIAIEQMFCAKSAMLNRMMKNSWAQSLEVAALSRVLAIHCTKLNADTAMLAGLVHRVGELPIIRLLDLHHKIVEESAHIETMIAEIHPHIGSLVLNAWNFPAELIDVPVHALDFSRTHDASADYADLVTVAIVQLNYEGAAIDRSGITAFSKLGISPDIEIMEMPMLQDGYEQSLEMLGA